jgi:hypothetical protein
VGSNGSSCSASNSNTNTGTTSATGVTTTPSPTDNLAVNPATGGTTTSNGTSNGTTTPPARTNEASTDPTFSRPGPFDAGGAFGPTAVPPTTAGTETSGGVLESGVVVGTTGANPSSQQNVFVQPQQPQSTVTLTNTPTFNQAAREGRAREARRRAEGNEPRVIGIAPRTERDLTWQMPDDPIIRY